MSNTDFDLLKTSLEAQLAVFSTRSDKRADIVIQQAADALDQTQYAAERDLTVSLVNRQTEMSRRVKRALRRMEDGSYGVCLTCEEPISVKRLQAVPWAELCRDCQGMSELRGTQVFAGDQDQNAELGTGR